VTRPPLRLLHCSDLHLHYSHPDLAVATVRAIRLAAHAARVDAILCAGDVFDSSNQTPQLEDAVAEEFARIGVPIIAVPGNHDIRYSAGDGDAFTTLFARLGAGATALVDADGCVVAIADGRMRVWGRGMPDHTRDNDPLAKLPALALDGAWNVALAHGDLVDEPAGRSSPIILTRHEPALASFDYLALGHWHDASQRTFGRTLVAYSGSASPLMGPATFALVELGEAGAAATTHRLEDVGVPLF
jgi:exonuclease SbcD